MRWIPLLTLLLGVPAPSGAQDVAISVNSIANRVQTETICLNAYKGELERAIQQLADARDQMRDSRAGDAARQDAARQAMVVEGRVVEISRAIARCVSHGESTSTASAAPSLGAHRTADHSGHEVQAAETSSLDSNRVSGERRLTSNVRLIRGLQVDGLGRANGDSVTDGVVHLAGSLDACYEELVDMGALTRGELDVVFTITPEGRVERVEVEGSTIENERFLRCVSRSARRLRVSTNARGGSARFSFTFSFGPQ